MRSERRTVTSCEPQQHFTTPAGRHSVPSAANSEIHHRGTEKTERNMEGWNGGFEQKVFNMAETDRLADSVDQQPASLFSVSSVSPW